MAALFKKKSSSQKKDSVKPKKKRAGQKHSDSAKKSLPNLTQLVKATLFVLFSIAVVIICFLGQKPKGQQIILNQSAPSRIVAEFPFEYESEILMEKKIDAVQAQVPPVFKRTFKPYNVFSETISILNSSIAKTLIEHEAEGIIVLEDALKETIENLKEISELTIGPETIIRFTQQTNPKERSVLTSEALNVLKSIYEDGIYTNLNIGNNSPQVAVIQLVDDTGQQNLPFARTYDDALINLRIRLDSLCGKKEIARTLFDIFRAGLQPNLLYDAIATRNAIDLAVSKIPPSTVSFEEGDTLIEPGETITAELIERLKAYRKAEESRGSDSLIFNALFLENFVLSTLFLITIIAYAKYGLCDFYKDNRALAIAGVSILLNLCIIRLILEIGNSVLANNSSSLAIVPYSAPCALASIIVAVLVGTAPAIMCALTIAVLFGIIQNNSIEFLLTAFLTGIVASFISSNILKRGMLLRAGLMAGTATSVAVLILGLIDNLSVTLVSQQALITIIFGVLSGVLAVGFLPIFEQFFKITTGITLLELTDFNHPLLRRMQMEAPGTYHHSLMVANLSENAAAAIDANPLLCRVCCLFHDVGKLVKPDYFVENQKDGINPHEEKSSSMSALIIKAHVKEGVELARKYKLPKIIIDVIRQHHGTGLIRYFYYQAQQEQSRQISLPFPEKQNRSLEEQKVDESTYRYDGPRPAFKESAIIFFADGVEAASRSLKKVTQPALEELIDKMFTSRIADGQLDQCPLTFQELHAIRSSFIYTLINMLHARIEYPKETTENSIDTEENRQQLAAS